MSKKIEQQIFELANPVVEENGLELVSVEFIKEGPNWYLRIYIDQENGVDLEDCQRVSRHISDILDEIDPIPHAYFLEVSSPGVERILQRAKDFIRYQGRLINVHTYAPVEGSKKLQGKLGHVNEQNLSLILKNGKELQIERDKIAQVRLAWEN